MPEANLKKFEKVAKFNSTLEENMQILSSMNQYYVWLGSILRKYAGERILDVGCGNGNLTDIFIDKNLVVGADYSKDYLRQINERFKGKKNFKSLLLDITNVKKSKELKKYRFDTVISMNTYEHIKDDLLAFRNTYEILEKGGRFLIIVPAMGWLYSILDYEGGHYRRYTKNELTGKLKKAGFKIEKAFYINVPGALGWLFTYVLLKKRIYSQGTFSLYNKLVPIFRFCETIISPPFGLSVICIAKKE